MKMIAISAQFHSVCGHTFIYPKDFAGYMMDDIEMIESSLIASQLKRIADTLERLLKISEMSR